MDILSKKLDLYEFKMALFDNSELEELLLLIRNFNMTFKVSGIILDRANIQYFRILVCGEALGQFDTLSAEVGGMTTENLNSSIMGLGL